MHLNKKTDYKSKQHHKLISENIKDKLKNPRISGSIIKSIIFVSLLIIIGIGLRYVFFELRPFVISYIEEITGYRIDFHEIKTDISNDFEIDDFRMYSRIEGDIIKVDRVNLSTKIGNVFGGTVESLISSLSKVKLSDVEVTINERFFESRFFRSDTALTKSPAKKGLDINKIKMNLIIDGGSISYITDSDTEYARIKNIDLEMDLNRGKETFILNGIFDYSTADLFNFSNPDNQDLINNDTPIKLALFNKDQTNHFKGNIRMDSFEYTNAEFSDILLGVDFTEEKLSLFTIEDDLYISDIMDYVPFYLEKDIEYNKFLPELHLDYIYENSYMNISAYMPKSPEGTQPLDVVLTDFLKVNYVKDILDIVPTLSGREIRPIIEHPSGYINVKLNLSLPDNHIDFGNFLITLNSNNLFHNGDDFSIEMEGNFAEFVARDLVYHSDEIGDLRGDLSFHLTSLGDSEIIAENFNFLGMLNLNTEIRLAEFSNSWERFHFITNVSKWSIPGLDDYEFLVPPANLDIYSTSTEMDMNLSVIEQNKLPLKFNLHMDYFGEKKDEIPIRGTIRDFDLTKLSERIPSLVKDGSNIDNMKLNLIVDGFIHGVDVTKSNIKLDSYIEKSNGYAGSYVANLESGFHNNVYYINSLTIPSMDSSFKVKLDINNLYANLEAIINNERYELVGNVRGGNNNLYRTSIGLTFPDNSLINQYGTIKINDNILNLNSVFKQFDSKGKHLDEYYLDAEIKENNIKENNILTQYLTSINFINNNFKLNLTGHTDFMSNGFVNSNYSIDSKDFESDVFMKLSPEGLKETVLQITSQLYMDDNILTIYNEYENESLITESNLKSRGITSLTISGSHKIQDIGIDGEIDILDADNKKMADYEGLIYIAGLDISNIYMDGIIHALNDNIGLEGKINFFNNKIGFKGELDSDYGKIDMTAGFVTTNNGFITSIIGKYNDTPFKIKSENSFNGDLISTNNRIIYNKIHNINLQTDIQSNESLFGIIGLNYEYINSEDLSKNDSGNLNFYLTYSNGQYNMIMDAYMFRNSIDAEGTLNIEDKSYSTDILINLNSEEFQLKGDLSYSNSDYNANLSIITPDTSIKGETRIALLEEQIKLTGLDLFVDNDLMMSINGIINHYDTIIEPNLNIISNKKNYSLIGSISYPAINNIPINLELTLPNYETYNINGNIGYEDSLKSVVEITSDNGQYYYLLAQTNDLSTINMKFKLGRQENSFGLSASVSFLDEGFINTMINIEDSGIVLDGRIRPLDSYIEFRDFDIISDGKDIFNLYGSLYYKFNESVSDFFKSKIDIPQNGYELIALNFNGTDNDGNIVKFTGWFNNDDERLYASINGIINEEMVFRSNDIFINIASESPDKTKLESNFSLYADIYNETSGNISINLGSYNINGIIGGEDMETDVIPLDINLTAKDIGLINPLNISRDVTINTGKTSIIASIETTKTGYEIVSFANGVNVYGNIGENNSTHLSVEDISFKAFINKGGYVIDTLEMSSDLEYKTFENNSYTIISADGTISYQQGNINIDITGDYNGEDLILTGDIEKASLTYPAIASDNLRFSVGENITWFQGSLGLDNDIMKINSNLNINDTQIQMKGGFSSTDNGLATKGLSVNVNGVDLFLKGEAGIIDDYLNTDVIINSPIANGLMVKGNIGISDKIIFQDLSIGKDGSEWILNGNVLLIEDRLVSNLYIEGDNNSYNIDGPIIIKTNDFSTNLEIDIIDNETGKTDLYKAVGSFIIHNDDIYDVTFSLRESNDLVLSLEGGIDYIPAEGKYSTDNMEILLAGDINLGITGYFRSGKDYALDTNLGIDYGGVISNISVISENFEDFNINMTYDKGSSGINIESFVEIITQKEIYTQTIISMSETEEINITGDIIINQDGFSLSDMVLMQNKRENLGTLNSIISFTDAGLYIKNKFNNSDNNLIQSESNISINEKGNIKGDTRLSYNDMIDYVIDDFVVTINDDKKDTNIDIWLDSYLHILSPYNESKFKVNIGDSQIRAVIPKGSSNSRSIGSVDVKANFTDIHIEDDIQLDNGLYISRFNTDLFINIYYLTNELFIELDIPKIDNKLVIDNDDGKIISKVNIEDFNFKSKLDASSNFRIFNISTYLDGEIDFINENGEIEDKYKINRDRIKYNGENINLNIDLKSGENDFYINGMIDYVFGDNVLTSNEVYIGVNDSELKVTGDTYILENGISLDNNMEVDGLSSNIKGDILFGITSEGYTLINIDKMGITLDDENRILIDGSFQLNDTGIQNNIYIAYQDIKLNFEGFVNIGSNILVDQKLTTDLIQDEILFQGEIFNVDGYITPDLTFTISETKFDLTGGFAFNEGMINFNDFGINSINYGYSEEGFIYTATGIVDISKQDDIDINMTISDGISKYGLIAMILNKPLEKKADIDLNIIMSDKQEIIINSMIDYRDDLKLNVETAYDNFYLEGYGEITSKKANFSIILNEEYDKKTNTNYITQSSYQQRQDISYEEFASAFIEVDLVDNFNSKLAVTSDFFNYYANVSLDPHSADNYSRSELLPKLPEPISISDSYPDKDYLLYTNGFIELNDNGSYTKYRLKTAHNLGSNGYLLDSNIRLNLAPDSSIETDVQFKMTNLWLVLNGDLKMYSGDEATKYTEESISVDFNTEIAFSEKGIYGNLDAGVYGIDISYGGIINLDEPNNINLDGSIKMLGLLYLINGNIFIDDINGLIMPDVKLYKDNNDLSINGVYNYMSDSHDISVKGFYNDNPYEMDFSLNNMESTEYTESILDNNDLPSDALKLYPNIELRVWGNKIFDMKSVLSIYEQDIRYNAIFNDTVELILRYNTPKDFLVNISHEPIKITDDAGNSFKYYTNDFNISSVDGNIRSRISLAVKDFISSNGENANLNISIATGHEINNSGLDDIIETISYGTDRDVSKLLEGFEFQNIEVKWKEIVLYQSSGEIRYNQEQNAVNVGLLDPDNRITIITGYDFDMEELFLNANIDGYDLIQILDNLRYSPNSRDNKLFAELHMTGSLFNFNIKDSYIDIDNLLMLSNNDRGIQTTSTLSLNIEEIVKNDAFGNKIYIPNTEIVFEPLIDSLFKPSINITGLSYSPKSGNTDLLSYILEMINGTFSLETLRYSEGDNKIILNNANISFSNRLFDIIGNLNNPTKIQTYYGLKASVEQIVLILNGLILEVNETEIGYYDEIFKIKSNIKFFGDMNSLYSGEFDISGLILNGFGQIQISLKNIKLNSKVIINDISSLLFVEKDLITFTSTNDKITGEMYFSKDNGVYTDISYSDQDNKLLLFGGIDGFMPWNDLNTLNTSKINLKLSSNLKIPPVLSSVVDIIEDISGDLSLNLNLKGKTLNPSITGKLVLQDGYLKITGYDEPISDIYTNIKINDKVNEQKLQVGLIDYISINHYGAEIYGTGEFYYSELFNIEGLILDITSGPMRDPNIEPLHINFKQELLEYNGNLSIEKLRVETDLSNFTLSGVLIPYSTKISLNPLALDSGSSSTNSSDAVSFLSGLSFDNLTVRMGSNVQLEIIGELFGEIGNLGTVSFGDMLLIEYNQKISKYDNQIILKGAVNDFNRMKIRGSISSKVGQINYLNNPFNIERAEIIFKPNQPEVEEEDEDTSSDIEEANTVLGLTNENTLAILRLEARTYKRYIDNSPVRITLDYDGPIEDLVDNLFSSLRGDYYGTGRIGQLSEGELAVILGISAEDYEKYRQDEFNSFDDITDPDNLDDNEDTQQTFQDLALDSVDNLFFQRLLNSIVNSLGFTSGLPFTFSIYSSGFRTIFDRQDFFNDPINAFVIAFSERLEILFGRGFPAVYFLGVPIFENIYVQGGVELINFVEDTDLLPDEEPPQREIYLKAKTDIDWASGTSWLLNSKLGLAYEPYLNLLDFDFTLQFSYKYMDIWFLNTQLNISYSRQLAESSSGDIIYEPFTSLFDLGLGVQFLWYF